MLSRLTLHNFRNLADAEVVIPEAGMVIIGGNGHGKSNFLEAVAYLSLLRSVRGARDADCVRFDAQQFHVRADCTGSARFNSVGIGFDRVTKTKRVTLDGVVQPRLSSALGAVPSVSFSPSDVALVSGGPSERRRYLDVVLSLTVPPYLSALQKYRSALLQRNAELRQAQRLGRQSRHNTDIEDRIAAWEPLLAHSGAQILVWRAGFAGTHAALFTSLADSIGEYSPLTLAYEPSALSGGVGIGPGSDAATVSETESALLAAYAEERHHEMRRGTTLVGPHRDDVQIILDRRELRTFGSAGQQRSAAIALRFLELHALQNSLGVTPLLLLDDPFAELDSRRASRVLGLLSDSHPGQIFLTVPRMEDVPAEFTRLERFTIASGVLTPLVA